MSAVLKFPDRFSDATRRANQASEIAGRIAHRREFGLTATQQFQRRAYNIALNHPRMSPAAAAASAVPHKSTTLGEWDGPGAA